MSDRMIDDKYDILFVSPLRERVYTNIHTPYGQRCLGAYLRKHSGFSSRTILANTGVLENRFRQDVYSKKTEIVGFYAIRDNYAIVRHMVSSLKKEGITTIVGGPAALSVDEGEMRKTGMDYCISGEGELSLNALMRFLKLGEGSPDQIRGLKFIDDNGAFHDNGISPNTPDLDDIGFFPDAWDYSPRKQKLVYTTMSGRGCPNRCAFCYEGTERRLRFRSVQNVMEEIDAHIREVPETRVIGFLDDTFTLNTARLKAFCAELKKRGLKWICEIHVAKLYKEPELIDEMIDAGLVSAQIGIESGSDKVLQAYKKNITSEMLLTVVQRIGVTKQVDLEGNFIIGGAMESKETLEESMSLAEKLIEAGAGIIVINAVYYAPYERTMITTFPDRYEMEIDGKMASRLVDTMFLCVNRTNALSREEIQQGMAEFKRRVDNAIERRASAMTRTELRLLHDRPGAFQRMPKQWKSALHRSEHIRVFMQCGFLYHSIFNPDAVPIRSFNDLVYDDGALRVADYRFEGPEKYMLETATGEKSFREIAEILGLSLNDVYRVYSYLSEKLLLYMELY